nr:histidine kinase [uncultured Rhodoferax sp.]
MTVPANPKRDLSRNEILLVERSAMVGSIIVSTARQLGLHPVRLVNNSRTAKRVMESQAFDGVIASLDDEDETLQLIQNLRDGISMSPAATPVAITASQCDAQMAQRIKDLNVRRILLKPFKIRELVFTIEILTGLRAA